MLSAMLALHRSRAPTGGNSRSVLSMYPFEDLH
jgi:hypothetical protein